jgi:hypothetical protein
MDPLDIILAKLNSALYAATRYFENNLFLFIFAAVALLIALGIANQRR